MPPPPSAGVLLFRERDGSVEEAGLFRMRQEQRDQGNEGPDDDVAQGRGAAFEGVVTEHQALQEVRDFHG